MATQSERKALGLETFEDAIKTHTDIVVQAMLDYIADDNVTSESVEYWRGRLYGLLQGQAIASGEDSSHGRIHALTCAAYGWELGNQFARERDERESKNI